MATTKANELGQLGSKLTIHNENITLDGNVHGQYAGFDSDFTASIAAVNTGSLSEGTNLYYTDARADARAQLKIDALVGSAPGALNTLEELGDALGDDANFSTTITNSIAAKLPLAGGTITGTVVFNSAPTFNTAIAMGSSLNVATDIGIAGTSVIDSNRRILAADGAENVPYITFAADTDTGLYRPGTDTLGFSTAGSERMRINTDGDISLASGGRFYFGGANRATSTNAQAYIKETGLNLDIKGNDNVRLLGDGGNVILHADYTGNVGIGTSSPSAKIDASGTYRMQLRTDDAIPELRSITTNGAAFKELGLNGLDLRFYTSSSERMRIDSNGDVTLKSAGVVTLKASPLNSLYGAGFNVMTVTGTGSAPYTSTIGFSNYSNTNAMVIQGTNVGIGTTSPSYKLSISQEDNVGPSIELHQASNKKVWINNAGSTGHGSGRANRFEVNGTQVGHIWLGANRVTLGSSVGDGSETLTVLGSNVGIGTNNPQAMLNISGASANIRLDNTGTSNYGLEIWRGGNKGASIAWGEGNANLEIKNYRNDSQSAGPYANIDFFTGGTNAPSPNYNPDLRMRIQQTGEVGIGTSNPTAKIEIRGMNESQDATAPANETTDETPITMLRGANGGSIQEWVHSTKAVTSGSGGTHQPMISWYSFESPGGWSGTGTPGQWEISCQISGMHASGNRVKIFKILPSNSHGNISTQGGLQNTQVYKVFEGGSQAGAAYNTTLSVDFYFGNSTNYGYANGTIYMKVTHASREPIMTMSARYTGGTGNNRNYHQLLNFYGTHELNNHGPNNISSLSIIHQTGTVHQVVQTVVKNRNSTNTTDADALGGDVGLKTFITPKSGNSKFLIQLHVGVATCTGGNSWGFILSKSGSRVDGAHGDFFSNHRGGIWVRSVDRTGNTGSDGNHGVGCSATYLDETSSAAGTQIFYQAGAVTEGSGFYLNRVEGNYAASSGSSSEIVSSYTTSTLTITEIEK